MPEPIDVYSDLASINVTPNGITLMFLRSLPVPAGVIDASGALSVPVGQSTTPPDSAANKPEAVRFEVIARVRMSGQFLVQLRELLSRTLSAQDSSEQPVTHEVSSSSAE
jgi:hypothetical protein